MVSSAASIASMRAWKASNPSERREKPVSDAWMEVSGSIARAMRVSSPMGFRGEWLRPDSWAGVTHPATRRDSVTHAAATTDWIHEAIGCERLDWVAVDGVGREDIETNGNRQTVRTLS